MAKFDLSVILPCYNEAEVFEESISRIIKVLDGTDYTWEIILIDDCSKDTTRNLIKKAIKKYKRRTIRVYFHDKNLGRGKVVQEGFFLAEGKYVGYLDIDLEVNEWYIPEFVQSLEKDADIVVGWRIYDFNLRALIRWLSSKGYNLLRKLILDLPYKDTEAGYKFFNKDRTIKIFKKCQNHDWFWDTEIMCLAYKHKLKVKEIPVAFVRRLDKTSTVNLIPDSIKYLKDLIGYKIKQQ